MDLGPVEILYSWQSCLLAVGVSATTTAVKRGANLAMGGKEKRKASIFITEVLLPLVPLFLGGVGALIVPLHPEKLMEYVTAHPSVHAWMAYGAWGAAVGQFSDYLYQRVTRVMQAMVKAPVLVAPETAQLPAKESATSEGTDKPDST